MNADDVVRIKGWERISWLRAGFSGRRGGVSSAFGGKSLNLGWKPEDQDANVAENRRRFLAAIAGETDGGSAFSLVTLRQVHGTEIQTVGRAGDLLETSDGTAVLEGDGLLSDVPGVMLGIQVADCVPVLVADSRRRVVAALHAGWRGTMGSIVERGVARMREVYGSRPEDMLAAIGPSIGPCCYRVGTEVRTGFEGHFKYAAELFRPRPELRGRAGEEEGSLGSGESAGSLDLWEANRRQLLHAGVPVEGVTVLGECSSCAREEDGSRRYFSHRAEHGRAGRMMGAIGIAAG